MRKLKSHWMHTTASRAALAATTVAAISAHGCATMAHKVKPSGLHMRKTEKCEGLNKVCPWVVADIALLFAGVVPGVIALVVDFGTGAWDHECLPESVPPPPPDEATSLAIPKWLDFGADRLATQ